jgi:IS30 family transposase
VSSTACVSAMKRSTASPTQILALRKRSIAICLSIAGVASRATRRRHQRSNQDSQSLCHRPSVVAEREEFGQWGCDLMMFRKQNDKVNVTSPVERVSRSTVAMRIEDRQHEPITEASTAGLAACPPKRISRSPLIATPISLPGND